ncbi:glycosyl transferase, family 25 [Pedobacter steynii]|uniref:Glycosyl transferase, family 25 n=1 Tax=Pedobacter steynii TaxID=430522 RepID=A0A1H0L7N9_9SPHI|nr:glycosyl transferase [Pedobacter steynii]NQX43432.1 glycosyl transferase [Pedobacter steynii]SDO63960.1 glycosyl transferase, family 25 [Pedobacter steynii]
MNEELENLVIPTYVINLKERSERRAHILKEFVKETAFDVKVIEACKHEIGAIGLWQSMIKIIHIAMQNDDDVIIICEDDHEFTEYYNKEYLLNNVIAAHEQGVEILSGGVGHFGYAVPLTANRYWINPFQSTQFIVLYKSVFPKMLAYEFKKDDVADLVLAGLTSHKMVLYPFISRQKDFGYSDITTVHNAQPGLVQKMFARTEERLEKLQQAYVKYFT